VRSTRTSIDESAMDLSHLRSRNDSEALESFNQPDHQLPALPIDEDSYFHGDTPSMMRRSDEPSEVSQHSEDRCDLDEKEMRRHLMDVESSFMPESAPAQTSNESAGLDDTYTELVKPGKTPPSESMLASLMSPESLPERDYAQSQNEDQKSDTPESQQLHESFGSNETEGRERV
jgi:hypothetical protein